MLDGIIVNIVNMSFKIAEALDQFLPWNLTEKIETSVYGRLQSFVVRISSDNFLILPGQV